MEPIEAGIISTLLAKFGKGLGKMFDELSKAGVKIDQEKSKPHPVDPEDASKGFIFTCTGGSGTMIKCKLVPTAQKNNKYWDIYIKSKDKNKKASYHNIPTDKVDDKITEFYDKFFGEGFEDADLDGQKFDVSDFDDSENEDSNDSGSNSNQDQVDSSTKEMFVKLSKVTCGTESKVVYEPIKCTYDTETALDDIKTICASDDLLSLLTTEPQMFRVVPEDDGLNVDTCETLTSETAICPVEEILRVYTQALLDCIYVESSTIYTKDMRDLYSGLSSDIFWMLKNMKDLFVATGLVVTNFVDGEHTSCVIITDPVASYKAIINNLIVATELYYNCFSHDIQTALDNQILSLKSQWLVRL